MTKNLLKEAQKFLEIKYFIVKLDKGCLGILTEELGETPFLLVTCDPEIFEGFILSYSVQFYDVHEAIDIVLNLQDYGPVVLEERFFVNKDGLLLFGEEAELHNNELFNMEIINKEIH